MAHQKRPFYTLHFAFSPKEMPPQDSSLLRQSRGAATDPNESLYIDAFLEHILPLFFLLTREDVEQISLRRDEIKNNILLGFIIALGKLVVFLENPSSQDGGLAGLLQIPGHAEQARSWASLQASNLDAISAIRGQLLCALYRKHVGSELDVSQICEEAEQRIIAEVTGMTEETCVPLGLLFHTCQRLKLAFIKHPVEDAGFLRGREQLSRDSIVPIWRRRLPISRSRMGIGLEATLQSAATITGIWTYHTASSWNRSLSTGSHNYVSAVVMAFQQSIACPQTLPAATTITKREYDRIIYDRYSLGLLLYFPFIEHALQHTHDKRYLVPQLTQGLTYMLNVVVAVQTMCLIDRIQYYHEECRILCLLERARFDGPFESQIDPEYLQGLFHNAIKFPTCMGAAMTELNLHKDTLLRHADTK